MLDFASRVRLAETGKTHLFFVGQAGFLIKSKSGQLLGLDLYLSDCVERVEAHVGYKRLLPRIVEPAELEIDCLIATHFHRDHFDIDAMPGLMENSRTHLFAAKDCEEDIAELNIDTNRYTLVEPGDHDVCGDFTLDFINCDHGTGAPKAVGVIVEVDEKRFLFVGDTCLRLDHKDEYLQKGKIDIMIAPINGAYGNLDEDECVELAKELKPGITVPSHYGMFASHGGNPGKFYEGMKNCSEVGFELDFELMGQGDSLTIE